MTWKKYNSKNINYNKNMGLLEPRIITDEEAEAWADNYNKWKTKQPEFISVEMTNKEIVSLCSGYLPVEKLNEYGVSEIVHVSMQYDSNEVKLENGIFYKKQKNSYNQLITVLPW